MCIRDRPAAGAAGRIARRGTARRPRRRLTGFPLADLWTTPGIHRSAVVGSPPPGAPRSWRMRVLRRATGPRWQLRRPRLERREPRRSRPAADTDLGAALLE